MTLFVCWQAPDTHRWHVVGRLSRIQSRYSFVYTKGAKNSEHFRPFGRMTELDHLYVSDHLLPLFGNRVLQKSRAEYPNYLRWLGLESVDADPMMQLARTGGLKGTDSLSMYPAPEPDEFGNYRAIFFSHGMRYMSEATSNRIVALDAGAKLFPMHDIQNPADKNALALRLADPAALVGYCPRFYAKDFRALLKNAPDKVEIKILQINRDAPIEFRILCELTSSWPSGFTPCLDDENLPIAETIRTKDVHIDYHE